MKQIPSAYISLSKENSMATPKFTEAQKRQIENSCPYYKMPTAVLGTRDRKERDSTLKSSEVHR